jgi:hypothetical protein
VKIRLDKNGYIEGFVVFGDMPGAQPYEDEVPADFVENCRFYRLVDGKIILDTERRDAQIAAEQANEIRARREAECFAIINRGALWYDRLTPEQTAELDEWYQSWLDAPATGLVPEPLEWLK